MKLSNISGNNISFKRVYTTGRDSFNYDSTLRPYFKEMEEISKGYNVEIKTGRQLYITDDYHDEQIPIYPTTVSISPESNTAYNIVPKIKLYINHAANPSIGTKYEAQNIIDTIKKGINIFKNR